MLVPDQDVGPRCIDGQPAAEYHGDRSAVSSSALKQMLISPAHCLRYLNEDREETPAMLTGTVLHAALLEPERFATEFAIVPVVDRRTKAGKQQWAAFCAEHQGKILVQREEADLIDKLRAGIARHPRASTLLKLPGKSELSLYWTDLDTGVRLKARPDRLLSAPARILVEIKSTQRADRHHFQKRIADLDYHLSLAMYREGIRQVFAEEPLVVFFVVEDKTFEICLYQPDADMLAEGERRFRCAVERYAHCRDSDRWPGYQPDGRAEEVSLPRWASTRAAEYAV